jgi:hypothetical protein
MFELVDGRGAVRTTATWEAFIRTCENYKPDAAALDPFVAINAVPESDNQLMRRVMTILKLELAEPQHLALVLAHHDNKAASDDEDSDPLKGRGAGDIVNAVRFELAVRNLGAKQAEQFGIEDNRRGWYFRAGSSDRCRRAGSSMAVPCRLPSPPPRRSSLPARR